MIEYFVLQIVFFSNIFLKNILGDYGKNNENLLIMVAYCNYSIKKINIILQ